ncbi:MAG: helix-turn-helix domain-containing protein, partial [Actinomycetota bacterium]
MPEAARADARTGTGRPSTGFAAIDQLLGGLRVGDNVVWRLHGASREPFTAAFLRAGAALPRLAYVSFDATAAEVLAQYGTDVFPASSVLLDCSSGRQPKRVRRAGGKGPSVRVVDDPTNILAVTAALTAIEREFGPGTRYVFDDLTTIQKAWGREAALGLFLEHCPRLFDLDTVAYWFLDADEHDQSFLERMTQLTQVVLDVEPSGDDVLVAVAKAQGRHSASAGKRARISLADGTGTIVDSVGGDRGSSGERLRQLRMDKGLSQAHLARQAGITPSALSQAERGVSALSEE